MLSDLVFYSFLGCCVAFVLQFLPRASAGCRCIVVLVLLALTWKYFAWRCLAMPPPQWAWACAWVWLFFAFECLSLAYEAWGSLVMLRWSNHSPEADRYERLLREMKDALPTVDVFICCCGEPFEIVKMTIDGAMTIEYPKDRIKVFVLDDAVDKAKEDPKPNDNSKKISEICIAQGTDYMNRGHPKPNDFKGGNLQHALKQTNGDYILLLDADFVCEPNILYRMLGFFRYSPDRESLGVVQVGQCFRNADPVAYNCLAEDWLPDEQTFFMTVTLPSRDAWGTAFSVGTNALVSRKALYEIGGFPHETITEDLEMSMKLLEVGRRTLVLNEPLAFGLSPTDISTFLKQRIRWCVGTLQHLTIRSGPLRGNHTLIQKAFYMEGVVYWLTHFSLVLILVAPAVFWWTNVSAIPGPPIEIAAVLLPRLAVRSPVMWWLSRGTLSPVFTLVGKSLAAFHISVAIMRYPLAPATTFHVSNTKKPTGHGSVYWPLALLFAGLVGMTGGGMFYRLAHNSALAGSGMMSLNYVWGALSMVICMLCLIVCIELPRQTKDQTGPNDKHVATANLGMAFLFTIRRLICGRWRPTPHATRSGRDVTINEHHTE